MRYAEQRYAVTSLGHPATQHPPHRSQKV